MIEQSGPAGDAAGPGGDQHVAVVTLACAIAHPDDAVAFGRLGGIGAALEQADAIVKVAAADIHLIRIMRWLGWGLVQEVRALDARLSSLEDAAGIDRAISALTKDKGE